MINHNNPYHDYKIRVLREWLSFFLKLFLGMIFGVLSVALLTKYITYIPELSTIVESSKEVVDITSTPSVDLTPTEVLDLTEIVRYSIICIEIGGIIYIFGAIATPIIVPMIAAGVQDLILDYNPFLYLG